MIKTLPFQLFNFITNWYIVIFFFCVSVLFPSFLQIGNLESLQEMEKSILSLSILQTKNYQMSHSIPVNPFSVEMGKKNEHTQIAAFQTQKHILTDYNVREIKTAVRY